MTAPLLTLSLGARVRVLSLICVQFISLMMARLDHWRRVSRPHLCPARAQYALSGFRRFACLGMAVVMFLLVPASPHVSRAAAEVVSAAAINTWQDGRFWWHSSGWAVRAERLRNKFLPSIGATAQRQGWGREGRAGT